MEKIDKLKLQPSAVTNASEYPGLKELFGKINEIVNSINTLMVETGCVLKPEPPKKDYLAKRLLNEINRTSPIADEILKFCDEVIDSFCDPNGTEEKLKKHFRKCAEEGFGK